MIIRFSTYDRIKRFLPAFVSSDVARVGHDTGYVKLGIWRLPFTKG